MSRSISLLSSSLRETRLVRPSGANCQKMAGYKKEIPSCRSRRRGDRKRVKSGKQTESDEICREQSCRNSGISRCHESTEPPEQEGGDRKCRHHFQGKGNSHGEKQCLYENRQRHVQKVDVVGTCRQRLPPRRRTGHEPAGQVDEHADRGDGKDCPEQAVNQASPSGAGPAVSMN